MAPRLVFAIVALLLLLLCGVAARRDGRPGAHSHSARSVEEATPSVKIRTMPGDPSRVFQLRQKHAIRARKKKVHVEALDAEAPPIENHAFDAPAATPTLSPLSIPCPPGYDPRRTDYTSGDVVEVYNTMFVCRGGVYEEYCNIAAWAQVSKEGDAEKAEELWLNAWLEMGACAAPELLVAELNVPTSPPTTSAMPTSSSRPSSSPYPTTSMPTYVPTYFPTQYPTYYPTVTPTLAPSAPPTASPSSSPLALSPHAHVEQLPSETADCASSQILFRIELLTDNYPTDISWQFNDRSNNVILLASPLEGYSGKSLGSKMMEPQLDIRDICLDSTSTKYEFVIEDEFADGMCCRDGVAQGHYKLMQYNATVDGNWTVLASGSDFKTKEVSHYFELQSDNALGTGAASVPALEQATLSEEMLLARNEDASEQTNEETAVASSQLKLLCSPSQRKITIEVQTDNFGLDNSWEFRERGGAVLAKNERVYQNKVQIDTRDVCLEDASLYEMIVNDVGGDGMCCRYNEGHYKIYDQSGAVILHGGSFQSSTARHLVNTTTPFMDDRDEMWLESHNKRRKYWHAYYNTSYIPLLWDESLKAEAQVWADTLLDSCGDGMHHDPEREFGENAAGNSGNGSWGTQREPEKIVARFVDYEVDWAWPENGHLTQTLWRSTKYVGCAESHKAMDKEGHHCHTQVCRYAQTGNCNMNAHTNAEGTVDWLTPMLEDVSHCGPICPTDGCRA